VLIWIEDRTGLQITGQSTNLLGTEIEHMKMSDIQLALRYQRTNVRDGTPGMPTNRSMKPPKAAAMWVVISQRAPYCADFKMKLIEGKKKLASMLIYQ
jgi:hypothetical protein